MNYDIHVGAIGGILGKIIAFIASLVIASLPLTGFLIWWGRKKKKDGRFRSNRINNVGSIPEMEYSHVFAAVLR